MDKKQIREEMKAYLRHLPSDVLQERSRIACKHLCESEEFKRSSCIMFFLSLPHEVQTDWAVARALKEDKTVLVPKIEWETHRIIPVTLSDMNEAMIRDRRGLRHPAAGVVYSSNTIDMVVVPGLGFDGRGNRLGRGGGFYDRFLSLNGFRGLTCGLALEGQFWDEIPVQDHDVGLHMLVTDGGIRRFSKMNT